VAAQEGDDAERRTAEWDEIVPFAHLAQLAEKSSQATVRAVDGRGHLFNNDLAVVAKDIKVLAGDQEGGLPGGVASWKSGSSR
jgi:hypothetical protein